MGVNAHAPNRIAKGSAAWLTAAMKAAPPFERPSAPQDRRARLADAQDAPGPHGRYSARYALWRGIPVAAPAVWKTENPPRLRATRAPSRAASHAWMLRARAGVPGLHALQIRPRALPARFCKLGRREGMPR